MATPSIAPRSAQSGLFNQSLSVRASLRMSGSICKASWRLAVQPCLPNGVAYSRQRATRCFAHNLGPWHHGSGRRVAPNNSFKPNLLRYSNGVAEEACHAVASTAQVGLTRALGLSNEHHRRSYERHPAGRSRRVHRLGRPLHAWRSRAAPIRAGALSLQHVRRQPSWLPSHRTSRWPHRAL